MNFDDFLITISLSHKVHRGSPATPRHTRTPPGHPLTPPDTPATPGELSEVIGVVKDPSACCSGSKNTAMLKFV